MRDNKMLKEVGLGIFYGLLAGWTWYAGDEAFVVGSIVALLFMWKLEWNRKNNQP